MSGDTVAVDSAVLAREAARAAVGATAVSVCFGTVRRVVGALIWNADERDPIAGETAAVPRSLAPLA